MFSISEFLQKSISTEFTQNKNNTDSLEINNNNNDEFEFLCDVIDENFENVTNFTKQWHIFKKIISIN